MPFAGAGFFFRRAFTLQRYLLIYKRLDSMRVSILGLPLRLLCCLFIALAIKADLSGGGFLRQRACRRAALFLLLPVPAMCEDAEADSGPTG